MAGRDAFLVAGGLFLLLAVILLFTGSVALAIVIALVSAGLFWYSTRAKSPAP